MAVVPGYWGIDVGQCALKAIRLESVDGVPTATAFDYIEHPKILSQPDADPETLTREALEKFLSRNPIRGDQVAIGVPGQSGLARFVKLPPVEEKKIDDIVKFEAKQQIPFPLEEVVWDFQKIGQGQVSDGFAIDTEIGLFAMKRDMISRYMAQFQQVGVDVHIVQMAPLALCNYVTYDLMADGPSKDERGKKKCIVALDLGTDNSNLIITDNEKIIWQRPIPLGGNHFTRALTKEMKLTFAKAEHVKRNAAKAPDLPNILKALKPVLTDFVGEVQRSLGYFTNTHRDATVDYMLGVGSGFKLPGLQKYLADKLNLDVRRPAKFERLAGESVLNAPAFVENLLGFPVAYGLAAQAMKQAKLTTNLLPPEITRERLIKAKKPWAVAAAAMVMLGTGVMALGYSMPYNQAKADIITKALATGDSAAKAAGAVAAEVTAKEKDVEDTQVKVQVVISGQEERLNWIQLHQFLDRCLPIPGPGGNLTDDFQVPLWNSQAGQEAAKRLRDRIANGLAVTASIEEGLREALAAVDIEAINTRYTDNLKGVYDNLETMQKSYCGRSSKDVFDGREYQKEWMAAASGAAPATPPADGSTPPATGGDKPEGAGWVVEIRGTTFFKQPPQLTPREFLRRALVWNLVRESRKKPNAVDGVRGQISHVFLYNVWEDKYPDPATFKWIGPNLLDDQLPPPGASTDPNAPPQPPMGEAGFAGPAGPAGAAPWTPLLSGGTTAGPGNMPGIIPGGGAMPLGAARGGERGEGGLSSMGAAGPGGRPGGMAAGGTGPYAKPDTESGTPGAPEPPPAVPGTLPGAKPKVIKPRYEFVVVFVWKEPTPSDKLLGKADAAGAPAAPAPTPPPPPAAPR